MVEPARAHGGDAEGRVLDLAGEGQALDDEEPGRPLDVGQNLGRRRLQPVEVGPAVERVGQFPQQGVGMAAQHPEQGGHVAVEVVDRLDLGPQTAAQEHAAHAQERFGVAGVGNGLDPGHQRPGEVALAAEPRQHAGKRINGGVVFRHRRHPVTTLAGVRVWGSRPAGGSRFRSAGT
jgi:hypothetical protein